jgi:hypothetical protein
VVKKNALIIFAGTVAVVAGVLWGGNQILKTRTTPLPETPAEELVAETPTAAEKTPQTSKVVVDEAETAEGETTKGLSGTVTAVSGQTLVLESEGDQVQITTDAETKITRRTWPKGAEAPERETITLSQIQVGDKVDAFVKVVGGQATASSIIVIVEP